MSKKKAKVQYEVEDHGNGFMVIGTIDHVKARKVLKGYVDKLKPYEFAIPTYYEGRSAVWLTTGPGEYWDGATDAAGRPLPR